MDGTLKLPPLLKIAIFFKSYYFAGFTFALLKNTIFFSSCHFAGFTLGGQFHEKVNQEIVSGQLLVLLLIIIGTYSPAQ